MFIFESGSICTYSLELYSIEREIEMKRDVVADSSSVYLVEWGQWFFLIGNGRVLCLWCIIGFPKTALPCLPACLPSTHNIYKFTLCGFMDSNLLDLAFVYLKDFIILIEFEFRFRFTLCEPVFPVCLLMWVRETFGNYSTVSG